MIKAKLSKTILCLSLSVLISGASINIPVFASTTNQDTATISSVQSQKESINIKKTINSFLNSKYDVMKTWNYTTCSNIIKDSKLLELKDKTNKLKSEWYKMTKLKIDNYTSNLTIDNTIKTDKDTYIVDVTYDVEFKLQKANTTSKSNNEKYTFEIKQENNKYYITKMLDLNEDSDCQDTLVSKNTIAKSKTTTSAAILFSNYDNLIDSRIANIDNAINNVDKSYAKYMKDKANTQNKSIENIYRSSYYGYNSSNAVQYAHIFATNPNKAYSYYTGNDCTNYVSQCANAGLIQTTDYWKPYNRAWNTVNGFYSYMTNNGYASSEQSLDGARLGDVAQFYNPSNKDWSHSVILTAKDSDGNWLFCGHSKERNDYPVADAYDENGYTNLRSIKFWH